MIGHGLRAFAARLGLPALLALLLLALLVPASAESWKTYRFGTVSVDAPATWKVTYQQRDREVQLASPDGVYRLLAFWWFPDEPLLGYADIVSHHDIAIAGQPSMLIVSEFTDKGIYSCHILKPRQNGDQFVINLEFDDKNFDKAMGLLSQILSRVRYEGKQGSAKPLPVPQSKPAAKAAPAPRQAPAVPTYAPIGDVQSAAIDNKGAVRNGPTKPTTIKLPSPIVVWSIQTYHWNNGRGQRPGTIAIQSADGTTFGPWPATGKPGQGGVRNAYWFVEPGVVLPAGTYVLIDSSPKTWATNAAAGNRGFVVMQFQQVEAVVAPPADVAAAGPDEGSAAETAIAAPASQAPAAAAARRTSFRRRTRRALATGVDRRRRLRVIRPDRRPGAGRRRSARPHLGQDRHPLGRAADQGPRRRQHDLHQAHPRDRSRAHVRFRLRAGSRHERPGRVVPP